jgi:hypothetical protein
MSKLSEKVALVTGGFPGHWRSDREASGRGWSERGQHVCEGRQRGFRRCEGD